MLNVTVYSFTPTVILKIKSTVPGDWELTKINLLIVF